jgi:hypothetical protein
MYQYHGITIIGKIIYFIYMLSTKDTTIDSDFKYQYHENRHKGLLSRVQINELYVSNDDIIVGLGVCVCVRHFFVYVQKDKQQRECVRTKYRYILVYGIELDRSLFAFWSECCNCFVLQHTYIYISCGGKVRLILSFILYDLRVSMLRCIT